MNNPDAGMYNTGNEFGKNVKGFGFGKPRQEKVEIDNRDYGYDPEKSFKQTRDRTPSALISR